MPRITGRCPTAIFTIQLLSTTLGINFIRVLQYSSLPCQKDRRAFFHPSDGVFVLEEVVDVSVGTVVDAVLEEEDRIISWASGVAEK